MELTSFKKVAIKSLKLPGDIKERTEKRHVIKLAESIEALGGEPMEPPIVENGTRELVIGRDRIAACMVNKKTHIWCRFADFEPGEKERAENDENLWRRQDNREKLLAHAAKLEEAKQAAARKVAEEKAKAEGKEAPKEKAPKKAAREAVAKKAGVKAESVRKAEQRQKAKAAKANGHHKVEMPPVITMGSELPRGLWKDIIQYQDALSELEKLSIKAQAVISKHAQLMEAPIVNRLLEASKALGMEARAVRPTHICPKCRAKEKKSCDFCDLNGFARAEQMQDVPKEWMKTEESRDEAVSAAD